MKTTLLLMAQHEQALLPLDLVARDYLKIEPRTAANQAKAGTLPFTAIRMGSSQKSPWMVHVEDLAGWIDGLRSAG
jgi:hypothetical protein